MSIAQWGKRMKKGLLFYKGKSRLKEGNQEITTRIQFNN
jgi:hypothetical protein